MSDSLHNFLTSVFWVVWISFVLDWLAEFECG